MASLSFIDVNLLSFTSQPFKKAVLYEHGLKNMENVSAVNGLWTPEASNLSKGGPGRSLARENHVTL